MQHPSVTLLGTWPPTPGISAYCLQLADALSRRVRLEVLTFSSLYPNALYPGGPVPRDEGFPATPPGIARVRRSLAWYNPGGWALAGLLTRSEVLHAQFWSLPAAPMVVTAMAAARMRGVRCVLTVHNLTEHERRRGFRFALDAALALSDAAIVHQPRPPEWFGALCVRRTGRPPFHVPHGALDLYARGREAEATLRARLGISAESLVFLFFGAIRPYKGLDVLLDAFEVAGARVPQAHLLVAGRPWEGFASLQAKIDASPARERIHVDLGYIPTNRVKEYFGAADVVVLPYRAFEAQSGVAMTAAAFGKPMIVSDVGGLSELQPDGDFVVQPGDAEGLARAMVRAASDPARLAALRESARRIGRERDWSTIAERTLEVYRTALCGAPAPP
jgi:glycosyltransferase involved in cell wall biosynthesis